MRNILLTCIAVFSCITAFGQTITGTVSDASGTPLPGVSIVVSGTTRGTTTDFGGSYSINASAGQDLVFSYLGMITKVMTIGTATVLNVVLEEDSTQLDEVVVTALGITRDKRSLGYATQVVEGESLNLSNEQNVLGSLAGRVAGVQVTGASGASMGGTQKIKIRGVNSIGGGDQPLMVVDGTPISNANFSGSAGSDYGNLGQDVNPADIESINVLKG